MGPSVRRNWDHQQDYKFLLVRAPCYVRTPNARIDISGAAGGTVICITRKAKARPPVSLFCDVQAGTKVAGQMPRKGTWKAVMTTMTRTGRYVLAVAALGMLLAPMYMNVRKTTP